MGVGWRAATQKSQWRDGADGVDAPRGDQDGIPRSDLARLAIQGEAPMALEYEIEFFRGPVQVRLGGGPGRERGLGEALFLDWRARAVQEAPDGGSVFG